MQLPVKSQPQNQPDQFGFYDIPYIYGLNYFIPKSGAGSNPGINGSGFYTGMWQDVVQSQGDYEFRLRRHVPSYAKSFNFQDAGSNFLYSPYDLNPDALSLAAAAHPIPGDQLVCPELIFPRSAGIRVQNSNGFQFIGLDSYWYGYYYFQGVKRIYKNPNVIPNYPYREKSKTYPVGFTLQSAYPWKTTIYQNIDDYDFELQAVFYTNGYGNNPAVTPAGIGFQIKLYDMSRNAMMSSHVDMNAVTMTSSLGLTGCLPTPPVIYPRGSTLQIDVQSVGLAANLPAQVYLNLVGVNRMPC
jgi:hypothetical protein